MTPEVTGAALGLLGASGICLAVAVSPPLRRPDLVERLAPYLRDAAQESRLLRRGESVTPFPTVERLLGPILRDLAGRVDRAIGGTASVSRRLDQAGRGMTVEQFRVEQVVFAAGGLAIGLVLAGLAAARGGPASPLGFLIVALVLSLGGVLVRDRLLTISLARREERMLTEFPTVAEMLALAVGAGESPVGALQRITRTCHGELASELRRALRDVQAGASIVVALEGMAARTPLPALARFVNGMAIAIERGTPLADVLRAQATDVREEGRRSLLATGGRKEIAMLFPVVFMVLPVTIIFALFPGFYSLQLAVP
jgi:tight adherence protein C